MCRMCSWSGAGAARPLSRPVIGRSRGRRCTDWSATVGARSIARRDGNSRHGRVSPVSGRASNGILLCAASLDSCVSLRVYRRHRVDYCAHLRFCVSPRRCYNHPQDDKCLSFVRAQQHLPRIFFSTSRTDARPQAPDEDFCKGAVCTFTFSRESPSFLCPRLLLSILFIQNTLVLLLFLNVQKLEENCKIAFFVVNLVGKGGGR